ncbi:MAG: TonB-dependent receptor [Nitrosomonas sp.]|nr:TonB-dependent receptor [Nitrosomonas sp.]MDP1950706.1 TonB-dependent receptor [Nitrosomonas sp.]
MEYSGRNLNDVNLQSENRLFKPAQLLLVIFFFDIPAIQAQVGGQAVELPNVTVAAPTADQTEFSLFKPVTLLQGNDLRRKREANLGDTLAQELGVTSSSYGPGVGRPIIRGQDGPRIRVLESGIGTGDLSIISPDHAVATDSLNASRIEILRGPATLLYGSGTSGGVVNVITERIPERLFKSPQGTLEARYNSAMTERTGAFNASGSHGQVSWNLEAFKRKTNDIKIPGRADINDPDSEHGVVRNSAVDTDNLSMGGSYMGERGFLGASISRLESLYGIPGPEGAKIDMGQTRYGIAGELDNPIKGFDQFKMRLNYNDYKHDELENSGNIGTRLKNNELEGRAELMHTPLADWQGVVGIQFQNRDFSAAGDEAFVPSTLSHSVGLFMLEKRNWERWQFDMGGRIERDTQDPQGNQLQSRDFNLYSVSTGGAWDFTEGYKLDFSATRGQRAPSTVALYANGKHIATNTFETGNNTLTKETSNNFDLALHKTTGVVKGKVNLFYNHINDYIFQRSIDSNGDGLADRVNDAGMLDQKGSFLVQDFAQTRAKFYGAEAEAIFALMPDTLDLRLFTDMVYGKLNHNGNIPRLTPQRFGLVLDHRWGPWLSNLSLMRVTRQDRVARLETETQGYTLLNTEVGFNVKGGRSTSYIFFVQGKNLLNSDIRVHTSFLKAIAPMPGRGVVVGIRGEF